MEELKFDKHRYQFSSKRILRTVENSVDIEKKKEACKHLNRELKINFVDYKELYDCNISYGDKNIVLNIALAILDNDELLQDILTKRSLPILKIAKMTRITKKFIEKYDVYIMLYILIFSKKSLTPLKKYLCIKDTEDSPPGTSIIKSPGLDENVASGIVLKKFKTYAVILTPMGEVVRVKHLSSSEGFEVSGKKKRSISYYYKYIISAIIIIGIICSIGIIDYNKVESTIVLTTTSDFKIEVNKYDKIVGFTSETEKGKATVHSTEYEYKSTDEFLKILMNKVIENGMVPGNQELYLIVTGERLKDTDFRLIESVIKDNNKKNKTNIKLIINNSGVRY